MKLTLLRSRGFSMVEVMVTIVVAAFGLLGLASLVLKGIQGSADSRYRTIAVKQAYDMADRLRSNPLGVTGGAYNALLPSGSGTSCSTLLAAISGGTPLVAAGSNDPSCDGSSGASNDNNCWQLANRKQLPSGAGAVCKDTTANSNWYAIFVSWDETRSGTTNKTFWMTFEP